MRIYKMTATFGKLEHETLTLEPGLNIIEAPNEWGKTTWCAFLVTMLYGLDTRAKSTKTTLADKERYAPWSGSSMAGRIDLNWNGRDITIERETRGRTPMGMFRAYETASGLAIPELTAGNCGQMLLGVEQSVFRRTGFIRQSDMPVTQDEALRRRLNALVTTGDETGDSDRLETELKELKNKCRYNRSGLLPQAEAQRKELEDRMLELESLEIHSRKLRERLGEVKGWLRSLENHRDALLYAAAEADAGRVAEARDQYDRWETKLTALETACGRLPGREEIQRRIAAIQGYQETLAAYQEEEQKTAAKPLQPVVPEVFRKMSLEEAGKMADSDSRRYQQLRGTKPYLAYFLTGLADLVLCLFSISLEMHLLTAALAAVGAVLMILGFWKKNAWSQERKALEEKYGSGYPEAWLALYQKYAAEQKEYDQAMLNYRVTRGDLDIQSTFLQKQRESLFAGQPPENVLAIWQQMLKKWDECDAARWEFRQAEKYLQTLQNMAMPAVRPPAIEDPLTYSAAETSRMLEEAQAEQQRLQNRLGQYQGRMEALGDAGGIRSEMGKLDRRIAKLEEIYGAVTLALDTLSRARQELQRRFAPRIAKRAQELLGKMTGGRYDRLTFGEDLNLMAGAQQEETVHEVLWRSDGTVDQLYLSLRLAVAEELTPEAPLVLDDAFVRFDDTRLQAALGILQEEAKHKQVILFTCQSREKECIE